MMTFCLNYSFKNNLQVFLLFICTTLSLYMVAVLSFMKPACFEFLIRFVKCSRQNIQSRSWYTIIKILCVALLLSLSDVCLPSVRVQKYVCVCVHLCITNVGIAIDDLFFQGLSLVVSQYVVIYVMFLKLMLLCIDLCACVCMCVSVCSGRVDWQQRVRLHPPCGSCRNGRAPWHQATPPGGGRLSNVP